jgi:hypothetical protein
MKNTGWEQAEDLILAAHRRGSNITSVARVAEAAPTETEKQILRAHGQQCSNCQGRTTACPENNPDCKFSPARTVQQIIGHLDDAYQQWVRDHNGL